eukprot:4867775-Prymnesium_polylepis.2
MTSTARRRHDWSASGSRRGARPPSPPRPVRRRSKVRMARAWWVHPRAAARATAAAAAPAIPR